MKNKKKYINYKYNLHTHTKYNLLTHTMNNYKYLLTGFYDKENGLALEFVINQTEEICKLAVKKDGLALEFVKNQTDEICKLAVKKDGEALHLIYKNQTYKLRLEYFYELNEKDYKK